MFASKGIIEHLARGLVGAGAFAAALGFANTQPWLAPVAVVVGLLALRGCPMCWTVGLVETIAAIRQGRSLVGWCVDGRCRAADRPAER